MIGCGPNRRPRPSVHRSSQGARPYQPCTALTLLTVHLWGRAARESPQRCRCRHVHRRAQRCSAKVRPPPTGAAADAATRDPFAALPDTERRFRMCRPQRRLASAVAAGDDNRALCLHVERVAIRAEIQPATSAAPDASTSDVEKTGLPSRRFRASLNIPVDVGADVRRKVNLVDHQQISHRDTGTTLAWNIIAASGCRGRRSAHRRGPPLD